MDNDCKRNLKDAKEFIKKKDFNAALDACKEILKVDKNNYLGLVFSAVSFQELRHNDKALLAFVKASELQPQQLPAWQGLAAFLEQERNNTVIITDDQKIKELDAQLINTYEKLEELLRSDPVKQVTILKKKCELFGLIGGELKRCVKTSQTLLLKNDFETVKFVAKVLAPWMSQLNQEEIQMLEECLKEHITDDLTGEIPFKEHYLSILLLSKKFDEAVDVAHHILKSDPKNVRSLETLCVAFVQSNSKKIPLDVAEEYANILLTLIPHNKDGLLAKAQMLLKKGSVVDAKEILDGLLAREKNPITISLLCDVYYQFQHWTKIEKVCRSILSENVSPSEKNGWRAKLIESLIEQGSEEKMEECTELFVCCKGEKEDSEDIFKLLKGLHCLRSNDVLGCSEIIQSLEGKLNNPDILVKFVILKAEYLEKINQFQEAIYQCEEACHSNPSNVRLLIQTAKLYWNANQRQKSVAIFLSVVKINREISEPYVYLGTFYSQQVENSAALRRAVQCLEKAYQLDPSRAQTAKLLLDLYHRSQNTAGALKLLDVVIENNPRNCRWAWLQKGHFHLKQFQKGSSVQEKDQEAIMAISSFQKALRSDTSDGSCWEALGDAYMARGSYSAALKAFEKAYELSDGSMYSKYQMAVIKQLLGEYREAVEVFESLLTHHPDYVPALKGLAETLLSQAAESKADGFTGRVVDYCVKAFELLIKAAKLNSQFSCIWSLLGQVCLLLRSIPESDVGDLEVPAILLANAAVDTDSSVTIRKAQLIELGPKFFLAALKMLPELASLWYNLALSYKACFDYSVVSDGNDFQQLAIMAVKKAISLEPSESSHWNLLGLIADQPQMSQHAFIRAIELNPTSPKAAATWTNLGALYFVYGDHMLAHQCFKQSQNVDPLYVPAWIGQANIAELQSPSEAMDLFRHTTPAAIGSGRQSECEGSPSYAQWVITTLSDPAAKDTVHYRYSIVQMHAVPTAIDGLIRYIAIYPDDGCALNLLGLLYERQGLFRNAEEAFLRGIRALGEDDSVLNQSRLDKIKANLARVYTSLDRCDDATNLYASLQESELSSVFGIALAHFKAGRHEESFFTYNAALDWLAADDEKLSHLKVAMAMATFRRDFPDAEESKSLLFESCQLQPPSVHGLLALGALGLLTADETLTEAAFQETLPYQTEPRYVADITFLSVFHHWSTGNSRQARREICRNIHMLPNVAELWILLSSFQATVTVDENRKNKVDDGLLVARCAQIACEARRLNGSSEDHIFQAIDQSKIISLISLGYLLAGKIRESLIAAQKAVHSNPQSAASWSILLAAAVPSWTVSESEVQERWLFWLKQLIQHLRRECDVTSYTGLAPWLGNYERRLNSQLTQTLKSD